MEDLIKFWGRYVGSQSRNFENYGNAHEHLTRLSNTVHEAQISDTNYKHQIRAAQITDIWLPTNIL